MVAGSSSAAPRAHGATAEWSRGVPTERSSAFSAGSGWRRQAVRGRAAEDWPLHLTMKDVELVAENYDLDLLGFLGAEGKDQELKKVTQHPIAKRHDD